MEDMRVVLMYQQPIRSLQTTFVTCSDLFDCNSR